MVQLNKHVGKANNSVRGIIFHNISVDNKLEYLNCEDAWIDFFTEGGYWHGDNWVNSPPVSCHGLIKRDGSRVVLADDKYITYHAGYSFHNGLNGLNAHTIGWEVFRHVNFAEQFTKAQFETMRDIVNEHNFTTDWVTDHKTIRRAYQNEFCYKKDNGTYARITDGKIISNKTDLDGINIEKWKKEYLK